MMYRRRLSKVHSLGHRRASGDKTRKPEGVVVVVGILLASFPNPVNVNPSPDGLNSRIP
jgi:hypothetical protein